MGQVGYAAHLQCSNMDTVMHAVPNRLLSQRCGSAGASLARKKAVDSASRLKISDPTSRDAPTSFEGTPPTAMHRLAYAFRLLR